MKSIPDGLMTDTVQTFCPHPSKPSFVLPAKACDSHVHVFGPASRFAFSKDSKINPVDASKEALFQLHRHLGIERCVIVQSRVHGFDNSVVEDAIRAGAGRYLGVALVPHQVSDKELLRLKSAGFSGVRFNFSAHMGQGATAQQVLDLTQRLAPLQLHLQVHLESALIHEIAPIFKQSAVPVVIDHMGRVDALSGEDHADFRALHRLMQDQRFYVKVSGIDRVSMGRPYAEGIVLARRLLTDFPDRCFWGTDWPHPNHQHIPDDGELVNALAQIAPTAAAMQALLVDNPQNFYQFSE
jgi:2-pyrone-4,6-dicarboxylate lactonase